MKTLILYETKTGYTKEIAEQIDFQVPNGELHNLEDTDNYNLKDYETIIVGAPIYEGELLDDAEDFFENNKKILRDKRLGIFCAGMDAIDFNVAMQKSLPPEIFYNAELVHCGGRINYKSLSFREKRIIRRRLGIKTDEELDNTSKIEAFIEWIKK